MLDRTSVHKSKKVKGYLTDNSDVKLIWLPKGSSYPNMIEQCWKTSKYALLVSEYYTMFAIMNKAVSEYFRVTKFKLDVANHIFRNPANVHELLIVAIKQLRRATFCVLPFCIF